MDEVDDAQDVAETALNGADLVDDRETWRAFYLLQYERIAQHESSRLQVSSFVMAGSVVGLGIAADSAGRDLAAFVFCVTIAAINSLAALWNARSHQWVRLSKAKADQILRALSPGAALLQESVNAEEGQSKATALQQPLVRMQNLLIAIHGLIAAAALVNAVWTVTG